MKIHLSLILLFTSLMLWAKPNDRKLKSITTNDGLSNNTAFSIIQDSEGMMWIGTGEGLNRYNGYDFTHYLHNSQDSNSITNEEIFSICEDANSNIWIATREGLNRYNREQDKIERIIDQKEKTTLSSIETAVVHCDKAGNIWAGTTGSGLLLLEKNSTKYQRYQLSDDDNINENSRIKAIYEDNNANIWIGTRSQGLYKINQRSGNITNYRHDTKDESSISGNHIRSITEDQYNNIWIGTEKNGVNILKVGSTQFSNWNNNKELKLLQNEKIRCLLSQSKGEMWLGTRNGIFIYDIHVSDIAYKAKLLPRNSIRSLFEDAQDIVWIGTYYEGVKTHHASNDYFQNITAETGLITNDFFSITDIMVYQDQLWLGTQRDGIYILDEQHKLTKKLFDDKDRFYIKTISKDKQGNVWVGTLDNGLIKHQIKTGKNTYYKHQADDKYSLLNNSTHAICSDSKGRLWIGSNSSGLSLYNEKSESFINISKANGYVDLIGVNAYAIAETNEGILCIGTNEGVNLYDVENNTNTTIYSGNKDKQLSQSIISTLYCDDSLLWIGTSGGGLNKLNLNTYKVEDYNRDNGLTSEMIKGIAKDKQNQLWVSTNNGLFLYDKTTSRFLKFDQEDGIAIQSFDNASVCTDNKGTMYFGGLNGIVYFSPEEVQLNKQHSPVIITGITMFNKAIKQNYITERDNQIILDLPHDARALTFELAALNYISPSKNSYAYKLDNYFNEWVNIGNKRSVVFTSLPVGEYTLHLKAANNHNTESACQQQVIIRIHPPLWQRWYAYVSYTILLFVVLYLFRRNTLSWANIKHQLEAEKQEAENIKKTNQLKLHFFTNISHEFRTPLTLIINSIQELKTKTVDQRTKDKTIKTLESNSKRLLNLISELMDFRKAESGVLELAPHKADIIAFTQVIIADFQQLAETRHIDIQLTTTQESCDVWFDLPKMEKILVNLISNALHHAKSKINVIITQQIDTYIIKIINDGQGILAEDQAKIFDRFIQGSNQSTSGTGIGLALTKQLVELHAGNIAVESTPGKTAFITTFPLEGVIVQASGTNTKDTELFIKKEGDTHDSELITETIATKSKENIILIVEDNIELSNYLNEQFATGYKVVQAMNGKDGLRDAIKHLPDLIISDIMMPKMDGIEMSQSIKENAITSHIPIILLTAKDSDESQVEGLQTGADAYIQKPFDLKILQAQVSNLLQNRDMLRAKFTGMNIIHTPSICNNKQDTLFLDKAMAAVEAHMAKSDYNIDSLCLDINMSRSVVYRKIKALTDLAPQEFIKNLRLRKAATLLRNEALSINEIATQVGFNNPKHFSTSFKKLYESSPREYRNTQAENQ